MFCVREDYFFERMVFGNTFQKKRQRSSQTHARFLFWKGKKRKTDQKIGKKNSHKLVRIFWSFVREKRVCGVVFNVTIPPWKMGGGEF